MPQACEVSRFELVQCPKMRLLGFQYLGSQGNFFLFHRAPPGFYIINYQRTFLRSQAKFGFVYPRIINLKGRYRALISSYPVDDLGVYLSGWSLRRPTMPYSAIFCYDSEIIWSTSMSTALTRRLGAREEKHYCRIWPRSTFLDPTAKTTKWSG